MMIGVDPKHPIELMQQEEQTLLSSSLVNHLHSSSATTACSSIYDNNNNNNNNNKHYHQKNIILSSRIRVGLRCLCPLDDKQTQLFDEIFSNNEQTTDISERILNEFHQLQTTILSSAFIRLDNFINNDQEKDLILRISVQEFLNYKTSESKY
ncbi:unnamed protein product [Rotaria sp. Silwood2]|nr:unnamed protein product [Rotaria sp. Silwood2]